MNTIKSWLRLVSFPCIFILSIVILPGCFHRNCTLSSQKASTHSKLPTISSEALQIKTQNKKQLNNNSKKPMTLEASKASTCPCIDSTPVITIFVHGTRLITKFAPQELFYSPAGMKAVNEIPSNYHMYNVVQKLSSIDPKRFQMDHFYLFGWSGKLSFEARKKAAHDFYEALNKLAQDYKKQHGVLPTFRIITHSHGGNVALNLASVGNGKAPFTISELILLACPIQEQTKKAIENPLFKRVYSFFSRGEFLQVIDPQGFYQGNNLHPFFSKRTFPNNQKLSQAEIKMYGRDILHAEFIFGHFLYKLPALLDALDKEYTVQHANDNQTENDYVIIDLKKKQTKKCRHKKHKVLII